MQIDKIQMAVGEAQRFILRATVAIKKAQESKYGLSDVPIHARYVRRSSLDLTRALSEMRKP